MWVINITSILHLSTKWRFITLPRDKLNSLLIFSLPLYLPPLLQQLFRSQNPGLAAAAAAATSAASAAAAAGAAPPGAPNGTMAAQATQQQQQQQQQMQMAAASQQFLAAQAQQNAAYAAQQAAAQQPYVINPGQEATPYLSMIAAAQMPQYYGVAPWGMYPGNLIPQQGTQPRRPLTPSQQAGAENQPYQVSNFESNFPSTNWRVKVANWAAK